MRFASVAALLSLAASSAAQGLPAIIQYGESLLSPSCQSTLTSLMSSNLTSCLNAAALAPLLTTNTSIVPVLDNWMTGLCSQQPCSNATLTNATNTLISGCATDLANYNVTNSTIQFIAAQYPLAREILCLKTTKPYNGTNASLPITAPTYNTTDGTFCVTSLLPQTSAYLGANLTTSYIVYAALGINKTVAATLESIPPQAACQDCIVAAADLILEAYPKLTNYSIANHTLSYYVNSTCGANYTLTSNGTLPSSIYESAINSTFPYNVTVGNMTFAPGAAISARSWDVTAAKRRWVGQQ